LVGPFKTDAGFVVVKVEDRRQEQPISLEEARPQIVRFLTFDEIRAVLKQLRAATRVDKMLPPAAANAVSKEPASAPPPSNGAAPANGQPPANPTPAPAPASPAKSKP
jgi:peptidyl-prolyl cis-trans isomerase C